MAGKHLWTSWTGQVRRKISIQHSMVHHQELRLRQSIQQREVLSDGQGNICSHGIHGVSLPLFLWQTPNTNPTNSAVFLANMALAIYSLIPTAAQRAASKIEYDEDQVSKDSPTSDHSDRNRQWEMKSVATARATPVVPYTPRTLAFNTLDRQLPLRAQQGQQTRWQ